MFQELSDKCKSFAQAGVHYRSSTEQLMTQAMELAKSLQDPALRKYLLANKESNLSFGRRGLHCRISSDSSNRWTQAKL